MTGVCFRPGCGKTFTTNQPGRKWCSGIHRKFCSGRCRFLAHKQKPAPDSQIVIEEAMQEIAVLQRRLGKSPKWIDPNGYRRGV